MSTLTRSLLSRRFNGFARALRRCERGVAAVEFGLLAPLLLLMFIGTVEISRAIEMDRRFAQVTAMVGDLVAREKTITNADLDKVFDIAQLVMSPYDSTQLNLSVVSVKASSTSATNTKVEWAYPFHSGANYAQCAAYTLSTGLVSKGGSVIVVESNYKWQPLFGSFIPGMHANMTWTDKTTNSPRNSCVDKLATNCVLACAGF